MIKFVAVTGGLTAFFVVLWGLPYVFHNRSLKIMTWVIWGSSLLVLAQSVYGVTVFSIDARPMFILGRTLESVSNSIGISGFLWGLAAVFILFSKRLFRKLRSKRIKDGDVIRRIVLLAQDHHNLFGWVTLAAATAHGLYFLFHQPNSWEEFYTGVGAWIALVLLAISGFFTSRLHKSPIRAKAVRISHMALTAGYAGAIWLHIQGSVIIAGILFTAAFAAVIVMWGLVRLTESTLRFIRK
ncbi:hypothetical protein [Alicyclobacillus sp. SO9]|uniref:hypothetical protein n=1 Tax=Alicyclobacillus sp. SO9 TaxID=2665646 RepID=UPI0018E80333|nr:hypothetical protein [Alicyclobacillus sp. SO9]QQE80007.1 hypothetical protein GI364_05915 [Alicyclobacillus sp. SO9]